MVDASKNGALLSKSYNNAYEIIERIANNNYQWPTNRVASKRWVARVHETDTFASLEAQVSSMSSMLKNIIVNGFNGNLSGQQPKYFPKTDFLNSCLNNNCSFTWKSIWATKGVLVDGFVGK